MATKKAKPGTRSFAEAMKKESNMGMNPNTRKAKRSAKKK